MRLLIIAVAAIFGLSGSSHARNQFPSEWGIIKKGAFVIPSKGLNWADPEGRATGKRIGYLRTGVVVKVGQCRHVNGPPDSGGNYCDVQSENGVSGKTLAKLIFPIELGKSYAVARQQISLFDRRDPQRRRDVFSRSSGVIIEIVGNHRDARRDENIDVVALYNLNKKGALTNLSIRKADLIDKAYVIEYPGSGTKPPTKLSTQYKKTGEAVLGGGPVGLWTYRPVSAQTRRSLVDRVSTALGWKDLPQEQVNRLVSKAFDLASSLLDQVFCVAEINTEVSSGFKFLGNGLELSGKIPLYRTGKLFDIDFDVLEKDGTVRYWVVTTKTVKCDMGATPRDSQPRAVEAVSVMVMRNGPHKGAVARLTTDMVCRFGLQKSQAVDAYNNAKLFEIEEFQNYFAALRLVRHRIAQTDLVEQLNRDEREALAHALISKLATFVRPSPDIDH